MTTTYTITKNTEFNSTEITFTEKPSVEVRDALKGLKFRWHSVKKVWYGYKDEETVKNAIENAENGTETAENGTETPKKAPKAPKVNKYGVKVGDVFYSSWGYDQTNVDWFQVVELVGETSARIREVAPKMIGSKDNGFMSAHRTYDITAEMMPYRDYSVHIRDNVKGDIKRIQASGESVYFKMASYANAYKVEHGAHEVYESWYA